MFTEIGAKGPEKARNSAIHKKQAKKKSFWTTSVNVDLKLLICRILNRSSILAITSENY